MGRRGDIDQVVPVSARDDEAAGVSGTLGDGVISRSRTNSLESSRIGSGVHGDGVGTVGQAEDFDAVEVGSTEERIAEEAVADGLRVVRESEGIKTGRASENRVIGQHQGVGEAEVAAGALGEVDREGGVTGGLGDAVVARAADDRVEGVRRGGEADRGGAGEAQDVEARESGEPRGVDVCRGSEGEGVRAGSDERVLGQEGRVVDDHQSVAACGEVNVDAV